MEDKAVKQELAKLFGERKIPAEKPGKAGSVAMLTIALCLGVALGAWPFVKTMFHDQPKKNTSLYYKVPADPVITPAVLEEGSVDILIFTGCAHHRHAVKTKQLNESGQLEV